MRMLQKSNFRQIGLSLEQQMAKRFFSIGTSDILVYQDRMFGALSHRGIRCVVNFSESCVELHDGPLLVDTFEFNEDAGLACDAAFSGYLRRIEARAGRIPARYASPADERNRSTRTPSVRPPLLSYGCGEREAG